jgi:hypothetical protein
LLSPSLLPPSLSLLLIHPPHIIRALRAKKSLSVSFSLLSLSPSFLSLLLIYHKSAGGWEKSTTVSDVVGIPLKRKCILSVSCYLIANLALGKCMGFHLFF